MAKSELLTVLVSFCAVFTEIWSQDGDTFARARGDHVIFEASGANVDYWDHEGNAIWINGDYNRDAGYGEPKYNAEEGFLEVTELQYDDGGEYTSRQRFLTARYHLVVVGRVNCEQRGEVNESQPLVYTCSIDFNGPKEPSLRWEYMDRSGNIEASRLNTTVEQRGGRHVKSLQYRVDSASRDDSQRMLRCRVQFDSSEFDDTEDAATSCTQSHYVNHAVDEVRFFAGENSTDEIMAGGQERSFDEDTMIYVHVNGHPRASYSWYCNDESQPVADGDLRISGDLLRGNDMNRCYVSAQNRLNREPYESDFIGFYGIADNSGNSGNDDDNNGSNAGAAGAIAAAVVIPILIIVIVALVGGWFIMKTSLGGGAIAAIVIVPIIVIVLVIAIVGYIVMKKRKADKGISEEKTAEKTPYENKNFQGSSPDVKGQAPSSQGAPPGYTPSREINLNSSPYGGQTQQGYPGRASPGYADLGVKHLSGSVPGLNESVESLPDPGQRNGHAMVNTDPRGNQPHHDPHDFRSNEPRGQDFRQPSGGDPRIVADPRMADPRLVDPRMVDPRLTQPRQEGGYDHQGGDTQV